MPFINELSKANSPYLLQHANNPVNWYPWSEAAFTRARTENKPILLSIGYAACHWCHVMAHESFEDEETAKLMNDLFINIKVDREERPDLDKIYQTTHYLLTQQSGGWPLTVFLTPDLTPFFSGTYFPKESRYHLPAFKEVLRAIAKSYQERPQDIQQQNAELMRFLNQTAKHEHNALLTDKPLQLAIEQFQQQYDVKYGGFGHAPKFPQTPKLAFLLARSSPLAVNTLLHMGNGGINDQLSGGFYRYSVDEKWLIPHFEKMLYDNGQLLDLYAQAATLYPDLPFASIAKETAEWLIHTMQDKAGGYYSSLDADSEGHEGRYYIWKRETVQSLLTKEEFALIELYFGLNLPANFEGEWHFYVALPLIQVAEKLNLTLNKAQDLFLSAKKKLLSARIKRIPPALDNKILTAWNSLAIKGMLKTGILLNDAKLIQSAYSALNFIQENLWINGRLLASSYEGKTSLPTYLDDYAFLCDALLHALQYKWDSKQFQFLQHLLKITLTHFYDNKNGGFYFTADDHETLLYRPKSLMDEVLPSSNGILVQILLIASHLLNEVTYSDAAEKTLRAAFPVLLQYPGEHVSLLQALNYYLKPPTIIIIRGSQPEIQEWKEAIKNPQYFVFAIPSNEAHLPPPLSAKKPQGAICAYICEGTKCTEVIDNFEEFSKLTLEDK